MRYQRRESLQLARNSITVPSKKRIFIRKLTEKIPQHLWKFLQLALRSSFQSRMRCNIPDMRSLRTLGRRRCRYSSAADFLRAKAALVTEKAGLRVGVPSTLRRCCRRGYLFLTYAMEMATCHEGWSPGGAPARVEGSGSRAWTRVEQVYPNLPQVAVARPGRRVRCAGAYGLVTLVDRGQVSTVRSGRCGWRDRRGCNRLRCRRSC